MRTLLVVLVAALVLPFAVPVRGSGPVIIHVPADAATIKAGIDAASPGDTVLVAPGTYQENVTIATPGITLAGEDRETVVLEGGGFLGDGVTVTADGVTVRSMSAQHFVNNGFVFTGVDGFEMTDLHAIDNGEYGLYAVRSTHGDVSFSFAEGHGDSGFYIGETSHCLCRVHDNVASNNMLGYSGTANSYVRIDHNEFFNNRAGILPNVLPQEFNVEDDGTIEGFQVWTEIDHNFVHDNNNAAAPETGIWTTVHVPLGEGVSIAGGWFNQIHDNSIVGNGYCGVCLFWLTTPERGNVVQDNTIQGGRYGIWWDEWGEDNCFENNAITGAQTVSDPSPLPSCASLGILPCLPADFFSCRYNNVGVPRADKDAGFAWRAATSAGPDEDPL